jgi:amidohydrolase
MLSRLASELKSKIQIDIDNNQQQLTDLSFKIHSNPEIGFKEYKASNWLTQYLENNGFKVDRGICNLDTAFKASYGTKRPAIAILAEYDALPNIGHACGHNLIAAIAVGAAVSSKSIIDKLKGSILVFGTPAEEIFGGKVIMVNRGAFKDIDIAMMVHPSTHDTATTKALSCISLEVKFFGREAHAAAHPEDGINALDAMVLSFNAINSLRQHTREDVRIHGIITDGGQIVNVIPAYSSANFLVRARNISYLEVLKKKVLECFKGAALATGAHFEYKWGSVQYAPMLNNIFMAHLYIDNMRMLGRNVKLSDPDQSLGSTDMGNVSQVVPSIHPSVSIAPKGISIHSPDFAEATASKMGIKGMLDSAKAISMTIVDLLDNPETINQVRQEFASNF